MDSMEASGGRVIDVKIEWIIFTEALANKFSSGLITCLSKYGFKCITI